MFHPPLKCWSLLDPEEANLGGLLLAEGAHITVVPVVKLPPPGLLQLFQDQDPIGEIFFFFFEGFYFSRKILFEKLQFFLFIYIYIYFFLRDFIFKKNFFWKTSILVRFKFFLCYCDAIVDALWYWRLLLRWVEDATLYKFSLNLIYCFFDLVSEFICGKFIWQLILAPENGKETLDVRNWNVKGTTTTTKQEEVKNPKKRVNGIHKSLDKLLSNQEKKKINNIDELINKHKLGAVDELLCVKTLVDVAVKEDSPILICDILRKYKQMPESSIVQLLSYILQCSDEALKSLHLQDLTDFWLRVSSKETPFDDAVKGKKKKAKIKRSKKKKFSNGDVHDWKKVNGHLEEMDVSVCDMEIEEQASSSGKMFIFIYIFFIYFFLLYFYWCFTSSGKMFIYIYIYMYFFLLYFYWCFESSGLS